MTSDMLQFLVREIVDCNVNPYTSQTTQYVKSWLHGPIRGQMAIRGAAQVSQKAQSGFRLEKSSTY